MNAFFGRGTLAIPFLVRVLDVLVEAELPAPRAPDATAECCPSTNMSPTGSAEPAGGPAGIGSMAVRVTVFAAALTVAAKRAPVASLTIRQCSLSGKVSTLLTQYAP